MDQRNNNTLRIIRIIDGTTVDGPRFRTSIYFAGCHHHCPGCHNPQSWDFAAGYEMTVAQLMERIIENDMDVTFSGGDPMFQAEALIPLAKAIKEAGKTLWCYTGYTYEELLDNTTAQHLLDYVDVLVDGRFVENLRDTSLLFRGSENQRLIDIAATRREGAPVIWKSVF